MTNNRDADPESSEVISRTRDQRTRRIVKRPRHAGFTTIFPFDISETYRFIDRKLMSRCLVRPLHQQRKSVDPIPICFVASRRVFASFPIVVGILSCGKRPLHTHAVRARSRELFAKHKCGSDSHTLCAAYCCRYFVPRQRDCELGVKAPHSRTTQLNSTVNHR